MGLLLGLLWTIFILFFLFFFPFERLFKDFLCDNYFDCVLAGLSTYLY